MPPLCAVALRHSRCVYCLDEREGKCDKDCHPDRECMTVARLVIYAYVYQVQANLPYIPEDEDEDEGYQ